MRPIERLAWYLKEHKIKFTTVERTSGLGVGYLSKQINSQASVGSDILEKICHAFPELNAGWLLTGKGSHSSSVTENSIAVAPDDKLVLIDRLGITDREKYELCKLLVQKLALQLEVLHMQVAHLRANENL